MRLPRSARSHVRRVPVQPVTPNNYTLARFTVGKSGVIFGVNRFGSRWLEVHFAGITLFTWFAVNNNPYITEKRRSKKSIFKRRVTA